MHRLERMGIIEKIQEKRDSKLITFIAGDRSGMETKIAFDIFPILHRHLTQIGGRERIDLFLYSTGGLTIAGYALVNLFREFSEEFNVIIPFKALSTATLIALGANEIMMTKMGQLSPIDPSVNHPLGPAIQIPGQAQGAIAPVNVEDVNAFVKLAEEEFRLSEEESMIKVFEILASKVNPIVLGAVHRSREQISFLASTLMKYHSDDEERTKKSVDVLTRERFSHDYIMSRREAKDILGLNITEPDEELTGLIIDLFGAYNDIIMLDRPYNPEVVLGSDKVKTGDFNRAVIESLGLTHVFRTKKEITRLQTTVQVKIPGIPSPVPQTVLTYQERLLQEEWLADDTI